MICHGSALCHGCEDLFTHTMCKPKITRTTRTTRDTRTNNRLFRKICDILVPFCHGSKTITRTTRDNASLDENSRSEALYSAGLILSRDQRRGWSA